MVPCDSVRRSRLTATHSSGVTEIIGGINPTSDADFFSISGLTAGGNYTINGIYGASARYGVLNSAGGTLSGLLTNPGSMTGTTPNDGILIIQVQQNEQVATYDLTLDASTSSVPEPSTLSTVGLALAAGVAMRRKLKK